MKEETEEAGEYCYMDNVQISYETGSSTGIGDYIVEIDQTSIPASHTLSSSSLQTASFTGWDQMGCENDFGPATIVNRSGCC